MASTPPSAAAAPHGRYLSSFGFLDRQGLLIGTNQRRYTLRLKSDYDVTDKLTLGQNLYVNRTTGRGSDTSSSYSGAIINAIYMPTAATVRYPDGSFGGVTPTRC